MRLNESAAPVDSTSNVPIQFNPAPAQAEELLGDLGTLAQQLGSPEDLAAAGGLVALLGFPRVENADSLQRFLETYRAQVLVAVEWPTILRAYQHASRYEARELIALDNEIGHEPSLRQFASASLQVGRNQLRRLRPLRDQKLVQRYLQAMEDGRAKGWHTLVYGLMLAVYSIPLRQGLLVYGRQTLIGFAHAAARPLHLPPAQLDAVIQSLEEKLPAAMAPIFAREPQLEFRPAGN